MANPHDHHVAERAAYLEDLLLVDRCLEGEPAAARELFRRQSGRIHATLYRILGNNRDMDDLLQDTFIQVFGSLKGFRGEARLSTWIDRIAVRVAYRHIARSRTAPLTTELTEVADRGGGPERRMVAREGIRRFYAALATLSPAARVAFTLHELDGRSVADIAACTESSNTATKVRIWRARRALQRRAADDPILREFLDDGATDRGEGEDAHRGGPSTSGGQDLP